MAESPYVSFFAGAGGLDLALRIAFPHARCIGAVEIGIEAAEILAARIEEGSLDEAPVWSDVRTFPSRRYCGRVAGVLAGFPCPDYSVAGKRAGVVGKHGQLWDDLAERIRELGPDWVLLENVSGILVPHGTEDGPVLPAGLWFVLGDLAALGFDAEWICLRASDVGASHGRMRWFCLAYRAGGRCRELRESPWRDGFTDGSHAGLVHADGSEWWPLGEPGSSGFERADGGRQGDSGAGIPGSLLEHAARDGESRCLGEDRRGRWRGVCETGEPLAESHGARWTQDGSGYSFDAGSEPQPGRGELGNAYQSRLEGWGERDRRRAGERFARPAGCDVANSSRERRQQDTRSPSENEKTDGRERWEQRKSHGNNQPSGFSANLPIFAPGPGATELWARLLVRFPWLRPAISQAETEPVLRDMADGLAALVDVQRTDALRAAGNGVVPLQVARALVELTRRAGITL